MSLFPPDCLGEYIERINGDPSRPACSICGQSPCESPGACRAEASFEMNPGHAGEFVDVDDFKEEECQF